MGIVAEIERLHALRERGALSAEEFERAKARLLAEQAEYADVPGATAPPAASDSGATGSGAAFLRTLARSRSDRMLGGVCGGLGKHTQLPSWGWRLIFCLVALYFGAGLLFYLLLWFLLPLEPEPAQLI
jgi:phage shock protein C